MDSSAVSDGRGVEATNMGRSRHRDAVRPSARQLARLKLVSLIATLVLAGSVGLASPASADHHCNTNFGFGLSGFGSTTVSAELAHTGSKYGMLRARASEWGPWEKFTLCIYNSYVTIKSNANGKYVSVEMNYTGSYKYMLRARATTVGPWEKFTKKPVGTGSQYYLISQANDLYVSSERTYTGQDHGMLRARASKPGPWELFGL
jgi:hypothetical protein